MTSERTREDIRAAMIAEIDRQIAAGISHPLLPLTRERLLRESIAYWKHRALA